MECGPQAQNLFQLAHFSGKPLRVQINEVRNIGVAVYAFSEFRKYAAIHTMSTPRPRLMIATSGEAPGGE